MIRTSDDWWGLVDLHWANLFAIIGDHMQMTHAAYEVPGNASSAPTGRDIATELVRLKECRDMRLARYFFAAWSMASESYAWSVGSWGVLCDLLSEEWVLAGG